MKKMLSFVFIVICGMILFPRTSRAQEPLLWPIVRLIYFYPSDRAAQPDIDEKMDKLIKDTQEFYAQLMEAHGSRCGNQWRKRRRQDWKFCMDPWAYLSHR